jgi:hypothetical protein
VRAWEQDGFTLHAELKWNAPGVPAALSVAYHNPAI